MDSGHHRNPESLQFMVFSQNEIKRLSAASIMLPHTIDVLGKALPGGLYDPALGPYDRDCDPCATCLNSFVHCSGHMGHIDLCMVVYNPVFISTVYNVLRITCLSCYQLQLSKHAQEILDLQLRLVEAGYISEAEEVDVFKSESYFNTDNVLVKTEGGGEPLHPKIAEYKELLDKYPQNASVSNKNIESRRQCILTSALRVGVKKVCIHCKKTLKRVKHSYKTLMITIPKAELMEMYKNGDQEDGADAGKDKSGNKAILADECRQYFRNIYGNNSKLLPRLFPVLKTVPADVVCPCDIFFTSVIPVTPPLVRPASKLNGRITEHPQTAIYKRIILANAGLRAIIDLDNLSSTNRTLNDHAVTLMNNVKGDSKYEKLYNSWRELQSYVDEILDINLSRQKSIGLGLKQILEKKEGVIRMNMMGKRVNFAARTVITPDPNVGVDEIGFPEAFAKKLTYPVPVTHLNIPYLRQLIMNGPDVYPGANYIENGKGLKTIVPQNKEKRESMAKLLFAPTPERGMQIVHRHLINGDILLLNRQPTLHRPSIMAHKARIMKGEKTFRMHYSNCKAYNADFDGDEMNAHCPQNEVARSEAYNLVNVANQYLVPKDGTPLGGLIQDHIIAGVRLSMRGRFFNRNDYQQLIYQGLQDKQGEIQLLPPAILKPVPLWSGKQVISTVIMNLIPDNLAKINLTSTAKIGVKAWESQTPVATKYGGTPLTRNNMSEAEVVIRQGELLVGVLDKMHYGATAYGLIHCLYELYGGKCSSQALTAFGRLFSYFLQWAGFTLGVEDILVQAKCDQKRTDLIKAVRQSGPSIVASALNLDEDVPKEVLHRKLEEAYDEDPKFRTILDRKYKSALDNLTNEINRECVPNGLITKFPINNLQLMIQSGAKGSAVNAMQISSLLGQIELEGKRPPLMMSGKALPSFASFETSAKSGGFIDGRFLTGIQPQEFFFHCMAGREGLIDTAVKTSRSGYLQRCLIKHLEGLSVHYDMTVRDSDKSVIQFMYGEDGMDISKCQFLKKKQLSFLNENRDVILQPNVVKKLSNEPEIDDSLRSYTKKQKAYHKKMGERKPERMSPFIRFANSDEVREQIAVKKPHKISKTSGRTKMNEKLSELWKKMSEDERKPYQMKKGGKCLDPITSKFPPNTHFGSISEQLAGLTTEYLKAEDHVDKSFRDVINIKGMSALAAPGEPVGLLAAQSIGEPSTQMTLNTFHFAGRGEMNVTLGIPRLREILMLASKNIKTPSMDIPFRELPNVEMMAEKLRKRMCKVTVADVLESINVRSELIMRPQPVRKYRLRFTFLPRDAYNDKFIVKPKQILKHMSKSFFKIMFRAIFKLFAEKFDGIDVNDDEKKKKKSNTGDNDEDDDGRVDGAEAEPTGDSGGRAAMSDEDSSDNEAEGDDALKAKRRKNQSDEKDYDEPEEEENQDEDDDFMQEDQQVDNVELQVQDETLNVLKSNEYCQDYKFDEDNHLWCELIFHLPIQYKSVDLTNTMREVAAKSVIWEVPKIKRAITYDNNGRLTLKTEGINIVEMFKYSNILDLNRLYSNDIHGISETYGIEAAGRVIVKEVQNVFNVYGITVDPRHLLLISDYMTYEGIMKPLSRKGMESSASPLQQMTFESCMQFLKQATVSGRTDSLSSPSSCLIVGKPCITGTGCFDLVNDNSSYFKSLLNKKLQSIEE